MYRVYKYKTKYSSKSAILILAKERTRFDGDTKFLDGICLGSEKEDNKYKVGFYAKNWGRRYFEPFKGEVEIKSKKNLFEYGGNLYLNTKNEVWEISKDGLERMWVDERKNFDFEDLSPQEIFASALDSSGFKRIDKFKIKNYGISL